MKLTKLFLILAATTASVLGLAGSAFATDTAELAVSASVTANCTITTTELAFGAYDPIVANKTAALDSSTGKVTITCTKGYVTTISLGQGAHYGTGLPSTRAMVGGNPSASLSYLLYQNSGRTTAWGESTDALTTTAYDDIAAHDYVVYGRIPAGQVVSAGPPGYADTVVATVNF